MIIFLEFLYSIMNIYILIIVDNGLYKKVFQT